MPPFCVFSLIFYQMFLASQNSQAVTKSFTNDQLKAEYSAVPEKNQETAHVLSANEARIEVLREFFARYNSPLEDFAENIVESADKYGIDYRLLPAIAMQESTLCLKSPKDTNNCWGFGIYDTKKTSFDNLAQGIETVSKTLSEQYHAQGLVEPQDIMSKYAPSNTGVWAENVSYVLSRISASL